MTKQISIAQLVLNFFDEYSRRIDYDRFTGIIAGTGNSLKRIGCQNVCEQALSNELWYWISNNFIQRIVDGNNIYLKMTPKGKSAISEHLENINYNLSEETVRHIHNKLRDYIQKK